MNIKASGRSALMVAAGIWLWCAGPLQAQETPNAAPPTTAAQQTTQPNPLQQLFGIKPSPAAAPAAEQPAAAAEPGKPVALNKYRKASSRHSRRHRASRSHRHSRKAAVENKAKSESSAEAQTESAADAPVVDADNASVPEMTTSAPAKDVATPLTSSVADAKAQLLDNNPTAGNATPLTSAPASIADLSSPAPGVMSDGTPAPHLGSATASEAPPTTAKTDAEVIPSDELNDVDRAMAAQAEPTPTLALASVNTPEPVTTGQAASAGDDSSSWAQASLIGKLFIAFGGLLTLASAVRMLIA
ncbi:MAG: hypothetical protein WBA48_04785 [Xanthobacteraceae bacterium]